MRGPLARFAPHCNRRRDEQQREGEGQEVAEAGEQGRRARRAAGGRRSRRRAPSGRLCEQPAVGVDHRGDAGRRGADHRQPLLDRAQPRLGEMLRRAPGAEPGVVGGVEDEVGPVGAVDDLAGEDDLVADLDARRGRSRAGRACAAPARSGNRGRPGASRRQADRRQERPHRQIFAIGDEMRLVVAADEPRRAGRARRGCYRRRSPRPSAPNTGSTPPSSSRSRGPISAASRRRARGLDRQVDRASPLRARGSAAASPRAGRSGAASRRKFSRLEARVPLVLLADIGLDDADRRARASDRRPAASARPQRRASGHRRDQRCGAPPSAPACRSRARTAPPSRTAIAGQAVGADPARAGQRSAASAAARRRPGSRRSR